jgi:hypothetical protein
VQATAVRPTGPAASSAAVGGEGLDNDRESATERAAIDLPVAGFNLPVQWDDEGPEARGR